MGNKYEELHQAIMVDFCNHMLTQTDDIEYINDYLLHLYTEAGVVVSNAVNGPSNDMLVNGWDGYRTTPKGNKFLGLSTDCDPSLAPVCVAIVLSPATGHVVPFMPINGNVFKDIQTSASDECRWEECEESSAGKTHDVYKMMADVDDFIESGAPDPDSHEDYPVHVWQDGVFTTLVTGDSDDGNDDADEDSDEDDTESEEWAESFVKMAEDNIASGMSEEDAYKDAVTKALTSAMTGIPPSLQDLLGKMAANGTQIHGVGPGGCVINVGADGSTTTVGGTDITGLFRQKPDTEAKPLEGFPYMGTPYELSDKFKANIRPRLRDKAKVLGTDEDELLEIYASNIPKSVLGIFHQLVQSSQNTEDIINIDHWFNHNGREGLLMSADTDGTTVNSIGSIPFTDYVVNEEVFDGVLKQVEELAARNPEYGYDKATKDFRHNK